jgi:uncharacterized protein (DUF1778 family)
LNTYILKASEVSMPRAVVENNSRVELRTRAHEKAMLARAASLERTDLTNFILSAALPAARAVIERAEQIRLSERDSLRVMDLLENPPEPNEKLVAAARALQRAP